MYTLSLWGRHVTPHHEHGLGSDSFQLESTRLASYRPLLKDNNASPENRRYFAISCSIRYFSKSFKRDQLLLL
jgi:hypothetical protein